MNASYLLDQTLSALNKRWCKVVMNYWKQSQVEAPTADIFSGPFIDIITYITVYTDQCLDFFVNIFVKVSEWQPNFVNAANRPHQRNHLGAMPTLPECQPNVRNVSPAFNQHWHIVLGFFWYNMYSWISGNIIYMYAVCTISINLPHFPTPRVFCLVVCSFPNAELSHITLILTYL